MFIEIILEKLQNFAFHLTQLYGIFAEGKINM